MPTESGSAGVDEYIAGFDREVQSVLRKVRRTVRKAAPNARELMSYRMPALKQNGMLVYYAAFKHHLGFFPPITGNARLEKAAARYAGPKGNLKFHYDEPIPYDLIAALTELRARQDSERAVSRRPSRSAKRPSRARR